MMKMRTFFNSINTTSLIHGYISQFCNIKILGILKLIDKFYIAPPSVLLYDGTMHVFDNKKLFACGSNLYGHLGLGEDTQKQLTLTEIDMPFNTKDSVAQVSKSDYGTIILTEKGDLYGCGSNMYGHLGLGEDTHNQWTLSKIKIPLDDTEDGADHVYAIYSTTLLCSTIIQTKKGGLYGCGSNFYGQLGLGEDRRQLILKKIPFDKAVVQVHVGDHRMIIQTEYRKWYGCGLNFYGQIGLEDKKCYLTLTEIKMPFGSNEDEVDQICLGISSTIFWTKKGDLYGCGSNRYGELGLGEDTQEQWTLKKIKILFDKQVTQVYMGEMNMIIQTEDGKWYGCGYNHCGQLGLGHKRMQLTLTEIMMPFGLNEDEVYKVHMGRYGTIFQTKKGDLYGCGSNTYGGLGLGEGTQEQLTLKKIKIPFDKPVTQAWMGKRKMIISTEEGKLYGCGINRGDLGLKHEGEWPKLSEINIPMLSASSRKGIVKNLKCWGDKNPTRRNSILNIEVFSGDIKKSSSLYKLMEEVHPFLKIIGVDKSHLAHLKKIKNKDKICVFGFLSVNTNQEGGKTVSLVICARNRKTRRHIWNRSIHCMGNFSIIKKVKISRDKKIVNYEKNSYQRGIVYQIKLEDVSTISSNRMGLYATFKKGIYDNIYPGLPSTIRENNPDVDNDYFNNKYQ